MRHTRKAGSTAAVGVQMWVAAVRPSVLLVLLILLGLLCPPAPVAAQSGFTFPLTVPFTGTLPTGWTRGGSAAMTSGAGDPLNNGWLRLTTNATSQAGYAYYNTPIPTDRGLVITFDYGAWGGTGADGLTFFLFDGATKTFNVGASGGSLGYAQKTGISGLSGGYLGLGLDEFGNYSNPNEGRIGGPGQVRQAVAVRGPGAATAGYVYLAGTTDLTKSPWLLPRLDCPKNFGSCGVGTARPSASYYTRKVQITVTPVGAAYQVAVAMKFSDTATTWTPLFGPFTMPTSAPGTLKMGFAASTGGSTNYHEIRNLVVTQQVADLTATKAVQNATTGGGSVAPGDELLYTVAINNRTSAAINSVSFSDTLPANTTYVANSLSAPSGASLNGTNPISITNITVPGNGQATLTFKVRVDNPIPVGVTQISNQGAFIYGGTTGLTDGDTQTDGSQATLIAVTAGPNFDTSTKTVAYEDLDNNNAVSPGDRLIYRVVLPNTGNQNSPTTAFADVLPSNTTYVAGSASASGGTVSYNSTTKTLNWTTSVNAGSQATLEFKVTVNNGVQIRDIISNQGTTTYGSTSVLTDADLATPGKQPTVLLAGGGATLTATKSAAVAGGGDLQPGGLLRYTIRLTNTGSYSITGATFADTIPANTTYVAAATDKGVASYSAPALSVTGIDLTSGVTATIQLTVQVNSPLIGVTQISNQGVASYDSNQGGVNNTTLATDSDPATAGQQPTVTDMPNTDLAIAKAVSAGNPAEAATIIYTVVVTNQGSTAASSITVTDLLPSGLTFSAASATTGGYTSPTWAVGTLAGGASATLTLSATVNLGRGGSMITNTASVTATLYDANPANNSASAGLLVQTTTLSGTVADFTTAAPLVGVTLAITDSQGNVCTATTGAGGGYLVTSGVDGCLLAPGTATIAATGGAPEGYLLRSAPAAITAGAANIGNLTLVRPSLSGIVTDLGSGVTLVSATVTITQGVTVCTAATGAGGAYSFEAGAACALTAGPATVTVAAKGYQATTAAPTILDSGPTTQNLALATADLLITKSDRQTTAQPGEILDYQIAIVNQGTLTATGIIVTDTLPAFTSYFSDTTGVAAAIPSANVYAWRLPTELAPGESTAFTLRARVAVSLPNGATTLLNYVTLTATSPDRDRTNNEVSDVDTVTAYPDLTLGKSYTATGAVVAGSVVTYQLSGANIGYATAGGVTIVDVMDSRVEYISGAATVAISDGVPVAITPITSTGYLTFTLPALPHDYTYFVSYAVTVSATGGTPLINTATISTTAQDTNLANNSGSIAIPTEQSIDAYVQKSAVASANPAVPGGRIVYTIIYGNNGADPAPDVVLTDPLPPDTALVADSITGGGVYVTATNTVSWTWPSLASQSTGTVRFTVQISTPLPAGVDALVNTASITFTSAITDVLPNNNTSSVSTPVDAKPDLTLIKSDGRTQVLGGDLLTYTLTYSNTGNQAATGVRITDTLVAGLEYVDSTPAGRVSTDTYTVTWLLGDLPVNAARTLTVTARVRADVQPSSVVANRATIADDRANGLDINPAGNTFTDSDIVIAPYIKLEKRASGPIYVGQPVTYTIEGYNSQYATAYGIVVTDTLPANTALVPGSITGGGSESGGVITWNMGDAPPGTTGTLSFAVIPSAGAGGVTQTVATLSTEEISGSLVLTSTAITPTTGSRPWCDFAACAAFRGIYQGEDGLPPAGWNDNPRLTQFDDSGWTQPVASSTAEFIYWVNQDNLSAEWVAIHTISETVGNFTFFRQPFCLPLNATGLSASIQAAGDDVSDIYLNGVYLGREVGAGAADTFDATPGLQSGINLLSVQLLNNRHGGHAALGGRDHSGLLFNMSAVFTSTRPFAAAPTTVTAGQTVQFIVDELALGGRKPYSYTIHYGDGNTAPYQLGTAFSHQYNAPGVYTATVTARAQYGCTGADPVVITVLPATANLLANPVTATYRDANDQRFTANSGAGVELLPVADLAIRKIVSAGARVPGEGITYQITVTNNGPSHVISATVTDVPPAVLSGVSWTCAASSNAACTPSGSGAIADTAAISVGGTITYSLTGLLAPGATGSLDNTATVAPPMGVTDLITANNSSTDSGALTPMARLGVRKSSSPNPGLAPGGEVRYTIVVTNAGPSDAVGAEIDDTFPAPLTGVTWTCAGSSGSSCTASGSGNIDDAATILVGSAITYNVVAVVAPATAPGVVLTNTATAGYGKDEASATDVNTVVPWTSLAVSKDALNSGGASSRTVPFVDADGNGGISPGDTLKYAVVISNGAEIAYNVLYNDSLDANTALGAGSVACVPAICTVTTGNTAGDTAVRVDMSELPAGSAVTIIYTATINDPLPFQAAAAANQGYAASSNAPAIASDDPATPETEDATAVALRMGMIRGVAWFDDKDGMWEQPGELGIPQVAVTLEYTDTNNQPQRTSTNTDANGAYTFTVLAAGQYRVGFGLNEGYSYSPVWGSGKDNLVDPATGFTGVFSLAANQTRNDISSGQISALEYGYLPRSYYNTTLVQDGARHIVPEAPEERLFLGAVITTTTDGVESATASGHGDGVTRSLTDIWQPGATGSITVTTSGEGLLWGWFDWNYDGRFSAGEGQSLGTVVTGTQSVTVAVGSTYVATNPLLLRFRLYPPDFGLQIVDTGLVYNGEVEDYGWYVIRGVVFNDENQNGVQDPGETARVGLPLLVRDRTGAVVATVQTGADGAYLLTGLNAGEYRVEVELPGGCTTMTCY